MSSKATAQVTLVGILPYRQFMCLVCGFIYNESEGWLDDDIGQFTCWGDIPKDWCCPVYDSAKTDF